MKGLGILVLLFLAHEAQARPATQSYDQMKTLAEQFEQTLTESEMSKLSLSYGQPLQAAFLYCAEKTQPQSFEVLSEVNAEGKIVQTWSKTPDDFSSCMAEQLKNKTIYSAQKKMFYSVLEFKLEAMQQ